MSRSLLALRMVTFVGLPLAVTWAALLSFGYDPVAVGVGAVISAPPLLYVLLALRFQITLAGDRLLVRALGTHSIPARSIRAVSVKQRGKRLVVVVDTADYGWLTLPAPIALTFWGREKFERQHEAISDWWESLRD
jgi:hypothetical protein